MERLVGSARLVSPFQLLWLHASKTMTVAALLALQSDLEAMRSASSVTADRAIFTSAIAELEALMVSRLVQELASAPNAKP